MSDQGGLPPAGWYPDPEVPGGQRYWDGTQWGEQRPPEQPAADQGTWGAPSPSDQPSWGSSGDQPSWGSTGEQPTWQTQPSWQSSGAAGGWGNPGAAASVDPWLWQSIVATVAGFLCCLPAGALGVVGIVKASQANSAKAIGDAATAQKRAGEARTWTLVAFGLSVVGLLFVIIAFATGAFEAYGTFS